MVRFWLSIFWHEQIFEDFAHLQTDGVAVFDEVRFRRFGQRVGDHVGQFVNFVAAQSQCNSLEIIFTTESQSHRATEKSESFLDLCDSVSL